MSWHWVGPGPRTGPPVGSGGGLLCRESRGDGFAQRLRVGCGGRAAAVAGPDHAVERGGKAGSAQCQRAAISNPDDDGSGGPQRVHESLPRGDVFRRVAVTGRRDQVLEDARRADDAGLGRVGQRHLDDLDAEQRAVGILVRSEGRAARQLAGRAHAGRARDVHVDVVGIVRRHQHGVGVRAAAGLHVADVARVVPVADVEDADAAQPVMADGVPHAFGAAVQPAAGGLARHEQQVAEHRHVALRAGAHVRLAQRRPGRVADVPHLPAAVVALDGVVADERQVGVGQPVVARRAGIHEIARRRRLRHDAQVPGCLAGIHPAGLEADARVGRGRGSAHVLRSGSRRRRGGRRAGSHRHGRDGQCQRGVPADADRISHGQRPPGGRARSMRVMRSISVV